MGSRQSGRAARSVVLLVGTVVLLGGWLLALDRGVLKTALEAEPSTPAPPAAPATMEIAQAPRVPASLPRSSGQSSFRVRPLRDVEIGPGGHLGAGSGNPCWIDGAAFRLDVNVDPGDVLELQIRIDGEPVRKLEWSGERAGKISFGLAHALSSEPHDGPGHAHEDEPPRNPSWHLRVETRPDGGFGVSWILVSTAVPVPSNAEQDVLARAEVAAVADLIGASPRTLGYGEHRLATGELELVRDGNLVRADATLVAVLRAYD